MENTDFFEIEEDRVIEPTIETPIKKTKKEEPLDKINVEEIISQVEIDKSTPKGYIPIEIKGTEGLLFAPKVLHFRNYYLEDIKELVQYNSGHLLFMRLISVLNNLVYEDFDCGLLHINELIEVMIKLYYNFISKTLKDMKYAIDESKPMEGDNIGYHNIDLASLDINKLADNVRKSFTLKIKDSENSEVTFSFPVINNIVLANKIVEEITKDKKDKVTEIQSRQVKISEIEEKITNINDRLHKIDSVVNGEDSLMKEQIDAYEIQKKMLLNDLTDLNNKLSNLKVTSEEESFIEEYDMTKKTLYLEIYNKLCIEKVDGVEVPVMDRLKAKIDFRYFILYTETINKYKFGIDNQLTFYCRHNKKSISRRFTFRLMDFIPSLELSSDTEYTISFD